MNNIKKTGKQLIIDIENSMYTHENRYTDGLKDGIKMIINELTKSTPQTFEELAEALGVKINDYEFGEECIEIHFNPEDFIDYSRNNELYISVNYQSIEFQNIAPPQAYEIISVLQKTIGG